MSCLLNVFHKVDNSEIFSSKNLAEILKFAEHSKPSLLFQTYSRMLMTYSQRRSKLNTEKFKIIVEQLKPEKNMGIKFKPFWELQAEEAEEKGIEKGIEISELLNKERERQTIIRLIRTTDWDNAQIAQIIDAPIALVKAVRATIDASK